MRYFRSANRVVRVDVDPDTRLGPEFLESVAEVYSPKTRQWVQRPELTSEIVYTGEWDQCSEDEAFQANKAREMRLKQQPQVAVTSP